MTSGTRNESLAVGTTSLEVADDLLGRSGGRISIFIRNVSLNAVDIITLTLGTPASVPGAGFVLKPGDFFLDSNDSGYKCWQGTIQGACVTANGVLAIAER